MSNHDTQVTTLNHIFFFRNEVYETQYLRNINSTTITDFQLKLRYEIWDNIFEEVMYVNIILKIF